MKKVAIITTHPVQYHSPLFHLLAERNNISIKVFYTWGESVLKDKFDPGFERTVAWDIPLLEGYSFTFVTNISKSPGSHHYNGIANPALIKEIETWGANAVLVFGWNFKSHLKAIRYFHNKVPVIFRGDSTLLDKAAETKNLIRKVVLKWVYRHIDVALYVGKENKKYYKYAGLKEQQLIFAPHAVDHSRFRFDGESAGRMRKSLDIPVGSVVFLFAGKLEQKKDPELLLKAFSKLNDPNAHLIVTGSGILEDALKSQFAGHPQIHFMPFQNQTQMPGLYSACDIFVLPSKGPGETWGLSVNEAMACGRAVLVSDKCGCAPDLVLNGQNGFVFEHSNENDLLKKMSNLISSPVQLASMKKRSAGIIKAYNFHDVCIAIETTLNHRS